MRSLEHLVIALFMASALPLQAGGSVEAVGRIEFSRSGGTCSAVLISPSIVATAAHCTPEPGETEGVSFRSGSIAGTFPARRSVIHPLYDRESPRVEWQYRFDLGAIEIEPSDALNTIAPMPVGREAQPGETLYIVSWLKSYGPKPRQKACPVLELGLQGLVTLGCEVEGGESGAPVLRKTSTGVELVAIVSSRARLLEQPVAQASDVRLRLPPLLDLLNDRSGT